MKVPGLKSICNRQGFTLVELMISIGVISILAGMAAQTFVIVLNSRDAAMKRIEISENGRTALDYIASDLRTAYLTPDSVKPLDQAQQRSLLAQPRFRFVGINRDVEVTADSEVPGAGIDDDGDGWIDEEVLDGIDGDFPNGAASSLRGAGAKPDPLGCEAGDASCIDEDIGLFPSDILHFVSAIENGGETILQEISYGLDPSGTKIIRRAQVLNLDGANNPTTELLNFGQFVDNGTLKRLVPRPVPVGGVIPQAEVRQVIENWDDGSKYGQLSSRSGNFTNKNPAKLFQVMAYDVHGLRFRYWYFDYNRGGWRVVSEWDSARETALLTPAQKLFNLPAANNSVEGSNRTGFENIIVNEPEDMYPRIPGTVSRFFVNNPRQLSPRGEYVDTYNRITERTDGLPNMVEITIYVQDRERKVSPKPFTTRVFIPNNYRNIGV